MIISFFFTIILGSQNNWWITVYTETGCGSIPVSTHAMRGTKVQFITDWAQRVNGSYSLYNIEKVVDPGRIRVVLFINQLSAVALSLWPCLRPAEERETDRRGGGGGGEPLHLWVSLLPRKPCLAFLTPVSDDITCQNCPLTTRDSEPGDRLLVCVMVCACVVRKRRGRGRLR